MRNRIGDGAVDGSNAIDLLAATGHRRDHHVAGPRQLQRRLGGLVEKGSVVRGDGSTVAFAITDTVEAVKVTYSGILPDLFREEQGVVAEGVLGADGVFVADTVLAKHDENYMPREVAEALKEKGVWQGKP